MSPLNGEGLGAAVRSEEGVRLPPQLEDADKLRSMLAVGCWPLGDRIEFVWVWDDRRQLAGVAEVDDEEIERQGVGGRLVGQIYRKKKEEGRSVGVEWKERSLHLELQEWKDLNLPHVSICLAT